MTASKPKILYIGPHNEDSDIGEISRTDLVELHTLTQKGISKIDLATRSIGNNDYKDPTWPYHIPSYDSMSLESVSHIIQYGYPERWERYGNYKHIGYLDVTQDNISKERFLSNIEMMDEIWSPTVYGCRLLEKHCNTPVKLTPHTVDLSLYEKDWNISEIPEISGTFKFLCSSNNVRDMETTIEAFFKEFDPTEPVTLVLRTHSSVNELIKSIKQKLKLYQTDAYQKIVLIDNKLSFAQMMGLYKYCDCYISELSLSPSTIAQTLPVRHAIGFDKHIIGFDNLEKVQSDMRYVYEQREKKGYTISKSYLFDKEFGKRVMKELI